MYVRTVHKKLRGKRLMGRKNPLVTASELDLWGDLAFSGHGAVEKNRL
jgi:hypothetical protein